MRSFWAWAFAIPVGVVSACGGDAFTSATGGDAGLDGSGGDVGAPDSNGDAAGCVAKTCAELHWACGKGDNGCGGEIDCGACHIGNFECGVTVAHACSCKPKTCADLNYTCGDAPDGCGGMLNCGTCTTAGFTCGGAGMDHRCGLGTCVKKTCAQAGAACGAPSDGCGSSLTCGTCPAQDICNPSYQCQCIPSTCGQLGWACGSGPDGCGGTLACPNTCTSMQTCMGTSCVNQGCTPTTSCAAQGYTCGEINNGCAIESCGSGPPNRNSIGDINCTNHPGKPNFYQCLCINTLVSNTFSLQYDSGTRWSGGADGGMGMDGGTGLDRGGGIDSGGPLDSGGPADSGVSCGVGAPNPPVPGWSCDIVTPGTGNSGITFCCVQ